MKPVHILRRLQDFPSVDLLAASQQRPARRPFLEPRQTHVEPRRVRQIGAVADEDHVRMRALQMDVLARILASDPFALARRQRDLSVDRQRQLQRDAWPAELQPGQPAGKRFRRRLPADAELHFNAGVAKPLDALARSAQIGVLERYDHARGLRLDEQVGAGWAARALMGAGLKRDIDRRALRPAAGLFERNGLGMRTAAGSGCSAPDDFALCRDDHAAHIGIGRAPAARGLAEPERLSHEFRVWRTPRRAHIPSCFSSFWNCRCFSFAAASLFAWSTFCWATISASVRFTDQLSA